MGKDKFIEIINEMIEIHEKSNKGFSGDFLAQFRMAETIGMPNYKSALIKVTHSLPFILKLLKSENLEADQTLIASLTSLAADAISARILIEEALSKERTQKNGSPAKSKRRKKSVNLVPETVPDGILVQTA